jgi:deoxyadenosine/deoxycytidine kinase
MANTNETIIMERSIYTDRNCFTELQVECGNMTKMEHETYLAWYNLMEIKFRDEIKADYIIYLRTTPEICYDRIKKRSRNGESSISMEYLQALHDKHEKWLNAESAMGANGTKIVTIDVSQDMDEETHKKFTKQVIDEILDSTNPEHPIHPKNWHDMGF